MLKWQFIGHGTVNRLALVLFFSLHTIKAHAYYLFIIENRT